MKHVLILYSSQTGHTEAVCRAAEAGAASQANDVETRFKRAADAELDDLLWADGLLIGTPENFGYMAGAVKDFLDRTYYPAQNRTTGLPYALLVSAGNDGRGAVTAIDRIAIGYGWKPVAEPIIVRGEIVEADLMACRELGEAFATGVALGMF